MAILKVRVKDGMMGYYAHKRRRENTEFVLEKESDFSHTWMVALGWEPKEKLVKLSEIDRLRIENSELKEKLKEIPKEKVEGPDEPMQYDLAGKPVKKKSGNNKEVI